jgi:hypothetical protein
MRRATPGGRARPACWIAAACACAAACATRPSPAPAPVPAATAAAAAAPAGPDPTWLVNLESEVAALRGRSFKRRVPFGTQTRDDFRHAVRKELAHDLPPEKAADLTRAYACLGLVEPNLDLGKALEDALSTQVAAYYDPKTRAFKVVGARAAPGAMPGPPSVLAHELAHALQDQAFDLEAYDGDKVPGLDDDQKLARRCVVEGEATFLMFARDLGSGAARGMHLGPLQVAGLRMSIAMLAAADMLELMANMRRGENAAKLDEETRTELAALEHLPPVVKLPLIEPYFKGAMFVSEVWARGGWPAVDDLFRRPPESTEQVLHPAEKFLAARDPPVRVSLPDGRPPPLAGARLLASEVMGELGWRVYFKTWGYDAGEQAAAGWGGDRFWAWDVGGRAVTVAATTWDSEEAARWFADAYEATLAARAPKAFAAPDGPDGFVLTRADDTVLALRRRGRDVDLVSGAKVPELDALRDTLRAVTRGTPATAPSTRP